MVRVPVAPQVQPQVQQEQVAAPQFQAAPSPGMQSAMQLGQDLMRAGQMAIGLEGQRQDLSELRARVAARNRQAQNEVADAYATRAVDSFMQLANASKDEFMLLENQQAFEGYESAWAGVQQKAREIGDQLQDPVVKQIYETRLGPKMAEIQRGFVGHANKQAKEFSKQARASHIANLQSDYARTDPEESADYMQAVFGSAVVAIGEDLQAEGIKPFIEDEATGERSMSNTYLKRVREWIDDAAESVVGNLLNQGRADAASAYIKDLIGMGAALSAGGTVGGILDPATQVALQRDISARVQRVSSPDLKIFDARTSELQDKAARAAGTGKTDDLKRILGDVRSNILAKNEAMFPGIKPDDPRVRDDMRDATTRVLTDGVDRALLGNNVALAQSLVATYSGEITAKAATDLQERIGTWQSNQDKLQKSIAEDLQAKANKDFATGIATQADNVSRQYQSSQEGGKFWTDLDRLMSEVGYHFSGQGGSRDAVVAEQRGVANKIAANVVDTFINANKPDRAEAFLKDLASKSLPRGEKDPSFSVVDHETLTALRGKVNTALASRDKALRGLMESVTNAEARNDAVAFASRLFDTGEYGGSINAGEVEDQVESAAIDGQQMVEIRDDSALVFVSADSASSQRDIAKRLSDRTNMRVEVLVADENSTVFELRPRSGTNMLSGGVQVPTLANGEPNLAAMSDAIEKASPNESWRQMALNELNRRSSAAIANRAREESAVLDTAIDQIRGAVLNGQAPSIDMLEPSLQGKVLGLGLGEKVLSIPREDNYVVMDNVYDDPGQYLNESYLKQNRYLLTETTYRRLLEQARNPDLPQDLPMSSDMFNDMMVRSGLENVAIPQEDRDRQLRYRIRAEIVAEIQNYTRDQGKRPSTSEVQNIALSVVSAYKATRYRLTPGWFGFTYEKIRGVSKEDEQVYVELPGTSEKILLEDWRATERYILDNNLIRAGMTSDQKAQLFKNVLSVVRERGAELGR